MTRCSRALVLVLAFNFAASIKGFRMKRKARHSAVGVQLEGEDVEEGLEYARMLKKVLRNITCDQKGLNEEFPPQTRMRELVFDAPGSNSLCEHVSLGVISPEFASNLMEELWDNPDSLGGCRACCERKDISAICGESNVTCAEKVVHWEKANMSHILCPMVFGDDEVGSDLWSILLTSPKCEYSELDEWCKDSDWSKRLAGPGVACDKKGLNKKMPSGILFTSPHLPPEINTICKHISAGFISAERVSRHWYRKELGFETASSWNLGYQCPESQIIAVCGDELTCDETIEQWKRLDFGTVVCDQSNLPLREDPSRHHLEDPWLHKIVLAHFVDVCGHRRFGELCPDLPDHFIGDD